MSRLANIFRALAICSLLTIGVLWITAAALAVPLSQSNYTARSACPAPAPGAASCLVLQLQPATSAAQARVHPFGVASNAHAGTTVASECPHDYEASCLTPRELNNVYFPGEEPDGPVAQAERQTIALVDAYNDPEAAHDLQVYDNEFNLPECSVANGCFEQVNENGDAAPESLPFPRSAQEREAEEATCKSRGERATKEAACKAVEEAEGWALEISTDVELAHGICQNCRILLVEARSPEYGELETAEDEAVALGATEISNSWGGQAPPSDSAAFKHTGVVITAAAGDDGYLNWDQYSTRNKAGSPYFEGADYPASSPHVVGVGGTSLTVGTGGAWQGETVWNDAEGAGGGGCSELPAQPWQREASSKVGCSGSKRAVADVAADADPVTGVAIYDSVPFPQEESEPRPSDWTPVGGTSVASPIIASMFALAGGAHGVDYPAQTLYQHMGLPFLHDVSSGGNGKCDSDYAKCSGALTSPLDCGVEVWICNATTGYDGPTGVGTPNGIAAFKPSEGAEGEPQRTPGEELGKSKAGESKGAGETEGGGSQAGGSGAGGTKESGSSGTGGSTNGSSSSSPGAGPGGPSSGAVKKSSVPSGIAAQAARISSLALTASARTALRHDRLTLSRLVFSCRLSRATTVRVTLAIRVYTGGHAHWRKLAQTLTFTASKGLNRDHLHGAAGLAPGVYRLMLTPMSGRPRSIAIRIA